jgi:Helix-turn-helix domain
MPQSISMAVRQSIIEQYNQGEKISNIATEFKISRESIYTLINRFSTEGEDGLKPKYDNCGKLPPDEKDFIYRAVRCLRTWHSTWGSEKIRAEMSRMRPDLSLPHYRTFVRWFHLTGQLEITLRTSLPPVKDKLAQKLHEVWQIDAKEEMKTQDGNKQCWLNITDEYSGTVMSPPVFPL